MALNSWTPERDAELVEHFDTENLHQLEERLGISRASISKRAQKLELGRSQVWRNGVFWTKEDDKRLKELLETGKPMREIGWALGKTKNAVIGRANRLGLGVSKKRQTFLMPGEKRPVTCQWPKGDGPYVFDCAEKPKAGSSYCAAHHALAYRKVEEKATESGSKGVQPGAYPASLSASARFQTYDRDSGMGPVAPESEADALHQGMQG